MSILALRSVKGGVGRTTLTALFAQALAARGRDVAVMDLDAQDSLRLHFGVLEPADPFADGGGIVLGPAQGGVKRVLNGPVDLALRLGAGARMAAFGQQLLGRWAHGPEILIIDTAAADDLCTRALGRIPHLDLAVALADAASLATLQSLAQTGPAPGTLYLLNQVDHRRPVSESALAFVRHLAGDNLLGHVRRDEAVSEALAHMTPLRDHAPASAAWRDVETLAESLEQRLNQLTSSRFGYTQGPSVSGGLRA